MAIVAIAGCAPATPSETPAPTASTVDPTPTPTPSATPEHTIAFGGDCSLVLSHDDVTGLVGVGTKPVQYDAARDVGIATLGGIQCGWRAAGDGDYFSDGMTALVVLALPTVAVSSELQREASTAACIRNYDSSECTLGADVDGVWVTAQVIQDGDEVPAALLQAMLDTVADRVPASIKPVGLARTADWWSTDDTCENLGERLGLADFLGEGYVTGWWEGDPSRQWSFRLLHEAGVSLVCRWHPDFDSSSSEGAVYGTTSLTASPGVGWNREAILGGGERVELASGQTAVVDGYQVVGVDDVNVAYVSTGRSGSADPTELLARVFSVMDQVR